MRSERNKREIALVAVVTSLLILVSYVALGNLSSSKTDFQENMPITIRLETDKPSYMLGEVVQIKVYFVNHDTNVFKFGELDLGYEVLNSKGEVIYSIGADYLYSSENPFTLPPQSEIMFEEVFKWPQLFLTIQNSTQITSNVTTGTYTIRFMVLAPFQSTAETTVVIGS